MPARRRPLRWASAPTSAASNRLAPTRTDALLKRCSSRYSQGGKRSADRAYRTTSQRCGVSAQALAATLLGEIPLGDGRTLEVIWTHAEPRTHFGSPIKGNSQQRRRWRQRNIRIEDLHVDDNVTAAALTALECSDRELA